MTARSREAEALLLEARLGYFWFIGGREEEGIDRLHRTLLAYDAAAGRRTAEPTEEDEWALFHTIAWLTWLNHVAGHRTEAGSYEERHTAVWRHAKNAGLAVLGLCYDALHAMLDGRDDVEERFSVAEAAVAGTEFHWDRAVLQTNWSTYRLPARRHRGGPRRHVACSPWRPPRAAEDDFARVFSPHPLRRRGRERRPSLPGPASSGPRRPASCGPSGRAPAGRTPCSEDWPAWTSPRGVRHRRTAARGRARARGRTRRGRPSGRRPSPTCAEYWPSTTAVSPTRRGSSTGSGTALRHRPTREPSPP
ncbi:hypothetical protein ACRAWF_15115 [Streptomyces sp. L7]